MSADIVERLNFILKDNDEPFEPWLENLMVAAREAADTIEALRTENQRLVEDNTLLVEQAQERIHLMDTLKEENADLRKSLEWQPIETAPKR